MKTKILKNIAESTRTLHQVDNEIFVLFNLNNDTDYKEVTHTIQQNFIQFHFCIKGQGQFLFNQGTYGLMMPALQMLLLYNPQRELPVHLKLNPKSIVISIFISIQKFHSLFSTESDLIDFLQVENKDKKYYSEGNISSQMATILHQIHQSNVHSSVYSLYLKGKIYELLSIYFNKNTDVEQCPFLSDEDNMVKIRKAKEIIIQQMLTPPSLQELANEVGITLKKLKSGFKQVYGESVYNFLFDYKMEMARKLLEGGQYNINELSLKLGYSTPSHFISAFKKKFGTTPKRYLLVKE